MAVQAACRSSAADAEELQRLRSEVAAKSVEVQEARAAEGEYAAECECLGRDLAAERLRAKVNHCVPVQLMVWQTTREPGHYSVLTISGGECFAGAPGSCCCRCRSSC